MRYLATTLVVLLPFLCSPGSASAQPDWVHHGANPGNGDWVQLRGVHGATLAQLTGSGGTTAPPPPSGGTPQPEIGRASCRERV